MGANGRSDRPAREEPMANKNKGGRTVKTPAAKDLKAKRAEKKLKRDAQAGKQNTVI